MEENEILNVEANNEDAIVEQSDVLNVEVNDGEAVAPVNDENAVASAQQNVEADQQNVEEDFKEIISDIDAHFQNVCALLKFNKDKDANINKLTAEIQTYRDGLEPTLLKPIALNLIGFREDCKKSVREFKERKLSVEEAKKYLKYLVYDYEDLLTNINVTVDGEKIYYNNKLVSSGFDGKIKVPNITDYELPDPPKPSASDKQGVIDYLTAVETYIAEVLKSNSILDKTLKVYIENSALYESGIHQVVLYPTVNVIGKIYSEIKNDVGVYESNLNEENATQSFIECTEKVIEKMDFALTNCSVTIVSYVSDNYDPKKHRLLKFVYTDNADDNGRIANVYSDCYLMNERVIYPQKVDVIKFKENL